MNDIQLEQNLSRLSTAYAQPGSVVPRVLSQISGVEMMRPRLTLNWPMRAIIGIAAIALLSIVLMKVLSSSGPAWADVHNQVTHTQSVTFDVDGGDATLHVYIKGNVMRVEGGDGITIWNGTSGKLVMLKAKTASIMTTAQHPLLDLYVLFKQSVNDSDERLPDIQLYGKKVAVFKITEPFPSETGELKPTDLKVWVDPDSRLPVQIQIAAKEPVLLKNIRFDVELADSLFDTTIPAGYKVSDMGGISSSELKPPPSTQEVAADLTLHPGVGIGPLKFGDSKEKIIAVLGPPEKSANSLDFGYPSKGLYLLVHPTRGLMAINTISKQGAAFFAINGFLGKTDKGIAMDATRAQIEAAYGKPSDVQAPGDIIMLEYKSPHIFFILNDDHLVRLSMMSR